LKPLYSSVTRRPAVGEQHLGFSFAQEAGSRDVMLTLGLAPLPSLAGGINKDNDKKGKTKKIKDSS